MILGGEAYLARQAKATVGKIDRTSGWVLITGASAGIGRELARAFASRGFDLVLAARNEAALAALARELGGELCRQGEDDAGRSQPSRRGGSDGDALGGAGVEVDDPGQQRRRRLRGRLRWHPRSTSYLGLLQVNVVALTR